MKSRPKSLFTVAAVLLASLPASGAETSAPQSEAVQTNRKAWEDLAARGNPLLLLNAERFKSPQPAFKPPEKVPNTWTYREVAEQLVHAAYAVTAEQSPHRGRADLVAHCLAVGDWLTQECDENGLWYRQQGVGDPNVNRFTLGPLLDAVHMLQTLPAGREAWPRWKDKLDRALDHQRRAFRGEFAWEWVHPQAKYPNQDAYGPLFFWLSAELYGREEDRQLAQHIMRKTTENLRTEAAPHGGLAITSETVSDALMQYNSHALGIELIDGLTCYPRPEIYTYTFPQHAIFSGTCNGAGSGLKYYYPDMENPRREDTLNRVFLMGYRFDLLVHVSDHNAPFSQYLRRLIALRQQVKTDLYASDFRDEIGLGPLPEKVHAKLFRRRDGQSLTLNLVDRRSGEKAPFELTIDLSRHEFSQPGAATLYEFDARQTPLATHNSYGELALQIPPLTGEVAAIVVRRAPDIGP